MFYGCKMSVLNRSSAGLSIMSSSCCKCAIEMRSWQSPRERAWSWRSGSCHPGPSFLPLCIMRCCALVGSGSLTAFCFQGDRGKTLEHLETRFGGERRRRRSGVHGEERPQGVGMPLPLAFAAQPLHVCLLTKEFGARRSPRAEWCLRTSRTVAV